MAASTYQLISNTEDMSQDRDDYYTPGWIVPPCGMDPEIRGEDANGEPMESVAWPVTEDPEEGVRLMDRALAEDGWYRVSDWRVDGAEWAADIERLPKLWTITDVANHFGVSESRARAILAKHRIERVTGYPAAAVKAIQRPGQGARTDLKEAAMTTATTIPGPSGGKELDGWYGFINGGDYPEAAQKELAETLLHEEMNEFNALLPDGWTWFPSISAIVLPVDAEDTEELDFNELCQQASDAVIARFEEIEAKVLAEVGTDG